MLLEADVTEQQWRVLRVIEEKGSADATEIARTACLLMPSLTRIMQILETRGFCTRRPHPTDRRRSLVEITQTGRDFIAAHLGESNRIYDELEAQFGRDRMQQLLTLLNELADREEI